MYKCYKSRQQPLDQKDSNERLFELLDEPSEELASEEKEELLELALEEEDSKELDSEEELSKASKLLVLLAVETSMSL